MTDKTQGTKLEPQSALLEQQSEREIVLPSRSQVSMPKQLYSTSTLRERCQAPMEDFNDPLGRLFGSRVSIHLTRLCLWLGISANAVSFTMLFFGLAAGLCLLFGGWWSVLGFSLLLGYYILDCVDGEVARFKGDSNLEMAAFDYLTHYAVKGAMFTGLTVGLLRELHNHYLLLPGMLALLATYMMKALQDVPSILYVQKLLVQGRYLDGQTIYRNLIAKLAAEGTDREGTAGGRPPGPMPLRSQLRFLLLNFDFGTLLLLGAALIDAACASLPATRILGIEFHGTRFRILGSALNLKALLLTWYGFALPLNFFDHVLTYCSGLRLHRKVNDLIQLSREENGSGVGRDSSP